MQSPFAKRRARPVLSRSSSSSASHRLSKGARVQREHARQTAQSLPWSEGNAARPPGDRPVDELVADLPAAVPALDQVDQELGLPGLAGFWGEIFALLAAFSPAPAIVEAGHLTLFRVLMVFGAIGTVFTAGYFLWMMQRVLMGQAPERWRSEGLADINAIEWGTWTPLLVMILALGILPFLVFGITNPDVIGYLGAVGG
jgi:hypothetical protein